MTGEVAQEFVSAAKAAERNRGSVDFSKQCAEWNGFDARNAAKIAKMRAEGKWHF
ncbi:MAG: hypothetical protein UIH18_06890 [Fibrobacteraceae bacterium]|nr:hypothetical protein [Fibrobacteraceae bacterium]